MNLDAKFAVIFTAKVKAFDTEYADMAKKLRDLAISDYGCVGFEACTENDKEIAISYWRCEADIIRWKNDPLHQSTQKLGQERWYLDYSVEVVEIKRRYRTA